MSGGATRTTCPYCGVGCGIVARPLPDGTAEIAGDPEHPANFGRLCSKGAALGETLSLEGRLLHPHIHSALASWDKALDLVARKFSDTIAEHGPDSVAFYLSGQLLTEDYYVANKLMKGFIGSANIDTNSRLCMASSVAGHKRAFGTDTVPGTYEDLELAELVVLVGSNLAWCHPVLYQRLATARETRGTKVVVIDPRETATCEIADLHLAIAPGADVALFNGLLAHLVASGRLDQTYVAQHTRDLPAALSAASSMDLSEIAVATALSTSVIADFYELFAGTERVVTVYSQGVNQSSAGTDKVNAILNCHLATGRIGRSGMGPFSVTGQPNAMGGREVGGLANMLTAHMELDNAEHRRIVRAFWNAPTIAAKPGLKAVDLFRAVEDGRIKALWIMATNPVVSLPEADRVRAAIAACPFVIVSDVNHHTDTTALAHVLLPAAAWGEKDGTITNSERRISRQRAFLPSPGEARPDWWQMAEVAKRMGFGAAFSYTHPAEIFAEYARLTGIENDGTRDLDISGAAELSRGAYDALVPFQWPRRTGSEPKETRFFANGAFYTPDRRARFVPTPFRGLAQRRTAEMPLTLNTGRIRDQWHTMTRTAKSVRLMAHAPEPFVEIHPVDAAAFGIADGALAEIENLSGAIVCRAVVTDRQSAGSLFVPMHWTSELANRARVDTLVAAVTDPISGQPELKGTPVAIKPFEAAWQAYAVTRRVPDARGSAYFATAAASHGFRTEIALRDEPESWDELARQWIADGEDKSIELLAYHDGTAGQYRFAAFSGDRLVGALFVARGTLACARTWIAAQLLQSVPPSARLRLLAGRPGGEAKDRGPIVCACLDVGRNEIIEAITEHGAATVAAVGACVKAGTNCGSCRAEIKRILDAARIPEAV
ncbi:nitrate reductase [Hyphomicrobium sp. CS1BSMeth3]|uniref:nitrate reductase n=1 Tax=Hyphomicrobium sp. CS1BSMeth3 TaxID=1892844 RepID=UPI000930ED88|nr:nitrate reductase [Hyphomicrobium sp. CS1BSMeth3]